MRGLPGTPAYVKAQQDKMRQIVMNIEAHHVTHGDDGQAWKNNSIWTNKKEAEDWAEASLHAMSALTRKMIEPTWVPSPVAGDGGESEAESESSETSLDEAEKKKPPGKRKLKEPKKKKQKEQEDEDDAPLRDKHYQGRIPERLEERLKRIWAWFPNDRPQPRWNTPYKMQGTAKSMAGWTEDEKKAKQDYLKITTGRGELLTPGPRPGEGIVHPGWPSPYTNQPPSKEDFVYDLNGSMWQNM